MAEQKESGVCDEPKNSNMGEMQLLLAEIRELKSSWNDLQHTVIDVQRRITMLEARQRSPSKRRRDANGSSSLEASTSPKSNTSEAGSPRFVPVTHKCTMCGSPIKLKNLVDHYGECTGIEQGPATKVRRVRECLQYLRR